MIYFIQQGEDGPIKIGRASNVMRRLGELQVSNPVELRLVGLILEESELHIKFDHLKVRGEWYEPDEELIGFIENHENHVQPPAASQAGPRRTRARRNNTDGPAVTAYEKAMQAVTDAMKKIEVENS